MDLHSSDVDRGHEADGVSWNDPILLLATCGGIGRMPTAPGTAGALLGAPLALATGAAAAWITRHGGSETAGTAVEAALLAGICALGVPICGRAATLLGRGKDPGAIVFDEMAALPLVLLPVPPSARSLACVATAFVLFRIFDIAKPWPCRRLERLRGGLGIMADDWAAAAWAAGCLALSRALGLI